VWRDKISCVVLSCLVFLVLFYRMLSCLALFYLVLPCVLSCLCIVFSLRCGVLCCLVLCCLVLC
jgi:hypothetical protein